MQTHQIARVAAGILCLIGGPALALGSVVAFDSGSAYAGGGAIGFAIFIRGARLVTQPAGAGDAQTRARDVPTLRGRVTTGWVLVIAGVGVTGLCALDVFWYIPRMCERDGGCIPIEAIATYPGIPLGIAAVVWGTIRLIRAKAALRVT